VSCGRVYAYAKLYSAYTESESTFMSLESRTEMGWCVFFQERSTSLAIIESKRSRMGGREVGMNGRSMASIRTASARTIKSISSVFKLLLINK
jgi:hypothetical protein